MTISKLRWSVLISAYFILLFGAYIGLYFGYFLPTFSCTFVQTRAGTCYLLTLQQSLGLFTLESMTVLLKRTFYFSLLVIILGRAWCGWVCPLGFFQDALDLVRRKIGIGYIRFTAKLRKGLAWIKWVFLLFVFGLPLWVAFPLFCPLVAMNLNIPFCQICPGRFILPLLVGNPDRVAVNFRTTTSLVLSVLGLTFAAMTILGSLVKRRFWCSFCPLGFILSWYRKISFFKLKKNDEKCTRCEICYNVCPMEIEEVYKSRGREDVTFSDCILCLKCVEDCPEEDALRAVYLGKTIYRAKSDNFFKKRGVQNATNS